MLERVLRRLDLAPTLDPDLVGDALPEGRTLLSLLAFVREGGHGLTLAQVMAHFEGSEHAAILEAALRESVLDQLEESELDIAAELTSLQGKLALQRAEGRKAELEARWMTGGLTEAEKAEWTALQARQAAAKGATESGENPPRN
jgi:hypothetical protein